MKQVGARASVESSQWGEGPPSFPVSVRVAPARVCMPVFDRPLIDREPAPPRYLRPLHLRLPPYPGPAVARGRTTTSIIHKRMP